MVRNYKAKTQPRYNRQELLNLAEEFAKSTETVRSFAKRKNIPKSTVQRWLTKQPSLQRGHKTIFSKEEELILVSALKYLADCNMPFDRDDLKRVVKQFLDSSQRQSPFPDNIPGIDWLLSFEKRHPDLAKRKPQLLAQNRANNATPETINFFFDMFEKVVKQPDSRPNLELR